MVINVILTIVCLLLTFSVVVFFLPRCMFCKAVKPRVKTMDTKQIDAILAKLTDKYPERIYVGKEYTIKDLIEDLKRIKEENEN